MPEFDDMICLFGKEERTKRDIMLQQEMEMKKYRRRVLFVAFWMMMVFYAPHVNLAGLYVTTLEGYFHAERTQVAFMITIGHLTMMVGSFFAGKLLKKFNFRLILSFFYLICVLTYLGCAMANSIGMLYIMTGIRGFCFASLTVIPISIAINHWFPATLRGKALGMAMVGSGVGATVLNPVTMYIIRKFGWQQAYLFFGAMTLSVIPLILWAFYRSPAEKGIAVPETLDDTKLVPQDGDKSTASLHRIVGQKTFWLLLFSYILVVGSTSSFNANGPAFLENLHGSATRAAAIMAVLSMGLTVGKALMGLICDKKGTCFGSCFGVFMLFFAYLLFAQNINMVPVSYFAGIVMGIGMSVNTVTMPLVVADFYAGEHYGTVVGYMQMGTSFSSSFVPLLMAYFFDKLGDYSLAWYTLCGFCVISMAIFWITYRMRDRQTAS